MVESVLIRLSVWQCDDVFRENIMFFYRGW